MKLITRIPGLSDAKRIPRLGKIRLGIKAKKGNTEYPAESPFFVLPDEVAKIHGGKDVSVQIAKEMGATRKDVLKFIEGNLQKMALELPVMIPLEDINMIFPQSYNRFGSGAGLKCQGNGEEAQEKIGVTNEWKDVPCPCQHMKTAENPKGECARIARLMVILPDVSMGGVYQIDIGSINSIIDLNSALDPGNGWIKSLVGRVSMVPLILKRVATETHFDGKKQIHFTVQIEARYNIAEINMVKQKNEQILSHQHLKQIEAPEYANPETRPVDMIVRQSAEMIAMVDELRKLGEAKKLKKSEVVAVGRAKYENDDSALESIFEGIKARIAKDAKGTTAAEMAETLKKQDEKKKEESQKEDEEHNTPPPRVSGKPPF